MHGPRAARSVTAASSLGEAAVRCATMRMRRSVMIGLLPILVICGDFGQANSISPWSCDMRVRNPTFTARLVALCLMTPCSSTEASDTCSVADVLVDSWIRMARTNVSAPPTTKATRTEREFKAKDEVVLKGYSYSPALQGDVAITEDFVLLLPGSASSAAQLAETASRLALATRQEVFVFEYRGYASGSTVRPTAASIQQDVDGIVDTLGRRREAWCRNWTFPRWGLCDSIVEAFEKRQERQLARADGLRSGSGAQDSVLDQLSPVDEPA